MNDRVDFFCARSDHLRIEPNDALTMHGDRWAYCAGGKGAPHDWRPTGGMSFADVQRFVRRHAAPRVETRDERTG